MRKPSCSSGTPSARRTAKEHRYWSIVENRRIGGGRVVQRAAAVPGRDQTIRRNLAWRKSNRHPGGRGQLQATARLSPVSRGPVARDCSRTPSIVRLRLKRTAVCAGPRQWGGCWLALSLWRELEARSFSWGRDGLPPSRKEPAPAKAGGTRWDRVLFAAGDLPGCWRRAAEWRLHRELVWSAVPWPICSAKNLGLAEIPQAVSLSRTGCSNNKQALFDHLVSGRWARPVSTSASMCCSPI